MIEYKVKVCDDGSKHWYLNNKRHREDGPAVEWADGSKEWYLNGKRHREDGPAVEKADGTKSWCLNDKLHREDGPAIEWADGSKSWYLNDKKLTEEEFNKATSNTIRDTIEQFGQLVEHLTQSLICIKQLLNVLKNC